MRLNEEFLKDLTDLCRKHEISWLEIESCWIGGSRYQIVWDSEEGEEIISILPIGVKYEIAAHKDFPAKADRIVEKEIK